MKNLSRRPGARGQKRGLIALLSDDHLGVHLINSFEILKILHIALRQSDRVNSTSFPIVKNNSHFSDFDVSFSIRVLKSFTDIEVFDFKSISSPVDNSHTYHFLSLRFLPS